MDTLAFNDSERINLEDKKDRGKIHKLFKKKRKSKTSSIPVTYDVTHEFSRQINNSNDQIVDILSDAKVGVPININDTGSVDSNRDDKKSITPVNDNIGNKLMDLENENLKNINAASKYQIELLTEQLSDARESNHELIFHLSQVREELSLLRQECSTVAERNNMLFQQLLEAKQFMDEHNLPYIVDGSFDEDEQGVPNGFERAH